MDPPYQNPRLCARDCRAGLLGSPGSFFHPYPHSIPAQLGDNVLRGWTPPIKTLGYARVIAAPVSSAAGGVAMIVLEAMRIGTVTSTTLIRPDSLENNHGTH